MYVSSIPFPGFDFAESTGAYGYSLGLLMGMFEGMCIRIPNNGAKLVEITNVECRI